MITNQTTEGKANPAPPARPPRPVALPVDFDAIPEELQERPQWVLWRFEWSKGRWTKRPYRTTGSFASSTNPKTWTTFEAVKQHYLKLLPTHRKLPTLGHDGVGFCLTADDPYAGLDLDHCRDPQTGTLLPGAAEILQKFPSYTEVSPSGTGVKVFVRGQVTGRNRKGDVEVYSVGRYFTVTGARLPDSPAGIAEANGALDDLQKTLFGGTTNTASGISYVSPPDAHPPATANWPAHHNEAILQNIRKAKNGPKFQALYSGDTSGYTSPSEADAGLAGMLAFYTTHAAQIDNLMRQSGLVRSKWGREDYLPRTIEAAIASQPEHYSWPDKSSPAAAEPVDFGLIPSEKFAAADYQQGFLIKRILVANEPAIFGGKSKTMKTSLSVDLALSLATGKPFLGAFATPTPVNVAFFSGESGHATIQRTARCVAHSKGVDLPDAKVWWGFRLPQITSQGHLDALQAAIEKHAVKVLIIDPAYLCLLSGDSQGRSASNIFDMGPLLLSLSEIGQTTGATVILVHHLRKNSPGASPNAVPELEDLAMAGFAEFARQWILLGRREPYDQGSGQHSLWMNVGGSAGHSGCYVVDIDEGVLDDDFEGRKWEVSVDTAADVRAEAKKKRDEEKQAALDDRKKKLVAALMRFPEGETKTTLKSSARMNSDAFTQTMQCLEDEGAVEKCEIRKGNKTHDGFRFRRDQWNT